MNLMEVLDNEKIIKRMEEIKEENLSVEDIKKRISENESVFTNQGEIEAKEVLIESIALMGVFEETFPEEANKLIEESLKTTKALMGESITTT